MGGSDSNTRIFKVIEPPEPPIELKKGPGLIGHVPQRCPAPSMTEYGKPDEPAWVDFNADFEPDRETGVAMELKKLGYATGFTGKWHTGGIPYYRDDLKPDDDPEDERVDSILKERYKKVQEFIKSCGFDYADGIQWSNCDQREIEALRVHNLSWIGERSINFLEKVASEDKPFYLNICPSVLHGPHHVESLYADERLTDAGILDGPHVGFLPERRTVIKRLEKLGFIGKNAKSSTPFDEHIWVGAQVDGKDVLPVLRGEDEEGGHDYMYTEFGYSRALTDGRWKIILRRPPQSKIDKMKNDPQCGPLDVAGRYSSGPTFYVDDYPGYYDADQLYDLEFDPQEQNNLAHHPMYEDIFSEMKDRLISHMKDMPRPFDAGEADPYFASEDHRNKIEKVKRNNDLYEIYMRSIGSAREADQNIPP